MTEIELRAYIKDNMFNKNKQWKSTAYFKHLEEELSFYQKEGSTFNEKLYLFYHESTIPKCPVCGKNTKFIKLSQGFREYCSTKCSANSKEKKEKIKNTVRERYGVDFITQTEEYKSNVKEKYLDKLKDDEFNNKIIKKRTETNLKKHNVENVAQSQEIKKRIQKTNIKKYGVKYSILTENAKEGLKKHIQKLKDEEYNDKLIKKRIETNLRKYNVEYPIQSEEIKEKIKQTSLKKYGVENPYQSEEIKEKIKQTSLKKYGVEYSVQSEEFKLKFKETMLKKYGYIHHMMSDKMKSKIINNSRDKFYSLLINSDRLKGKVIPLFSRDEYFGVEEQYDWICQECGEVFQDNIDDGTIPRCPTCYPKLQGTSKYEQEIYDWLINIGITNIIKNDRVILQGKELDIYLPDYKYAIEFDGLYWHSELVCGNKKDHSYKTIECEKQDIKLIHIFEDEWINKRDIVTSIIKGHLNLNDKIYGRKCVLKEIDSKEASLFYEENHIQGGINSSINIGLFYEGELVSALSFSKPRFSKHYDYEITRFANKLNTSVIGGFAKMLKYFIKVYKGSIITYSDRRYFDGSIYLNNGFISKGLSSPNYYYTDYQNRYNRVMFQKHKLEKKLEYYGPDLTEWQNMQLNGWDRIYDCGNNIFTLIR